MPCTLEPWEIAWEEQRQNEEDLGLKLTDERLLEEVACKAVRYIRRCGKFRKAPPLVRAWAKRHDKEDRDAKR